LTTLEVNLFLTLSFASAAGYAAKIAHQTQFKWLMLKEKNVRKLILASVFSVTNALKIVPETL